MPISVGAATAGGVDAAAGYMMSEVQSSVSLSGFLSSSPDNDSPGTVVTMLRADVKAESSTERISWGRFEMTDGVWPCRSWLTNCFAALSLVVRVWMVLQGMSERYGSSVSLALSSRTSSTIVLLKYYSQLGPPRKNI